MDNTKIEWADATWNALRGCSKVSAGCAYCYAEGMAARFSDPGQWGHGIATREGGRHRWTGQVVLDEQALVKPLRWRKPRRIFVTSVSDPFHDAVTDAMLDKLFAVMALAPRHTFHLLTKRPERMRAYATTPRPIATAMVEIAKANGMADRHLVRCLDQPRVQGNVWLGATVENQQAYNDRAGPMAALQAAGWRTFASAEPLLGPVTLHRWVPDWLIAGGESGRNARPMHPAWPRELRDACQLANVPFFFKQWGHWAEREPGIRGDDARIPKSVTIDPKGNQHPLCDWANPGIAVLYAFGKKATGQLLDRQIHHAFPEVANA